MKNYKISVAMATYNGEQYIIRQLESILNQTIKPDEIIIVDDCSTDQTVELINNYIIDNDIYICKLYVNDTNIGYKKNFYNALKKVTGDIIFLSDQDDEWNKNKIEYIINFFCTNSNILSVNTAIDYIDEKSKIFNVKKKKNYYNGNFLYSKEKINKINYFNYKYISKHNVSPGCTMAFRREILVQFLEIYDYGLPHDWFINMLASYKNECVYIDEKLTKYRIHSSNAIGSNTSVKKGILNKTNDFRISDYKNRLVAINNINNYFKNIKNDTEDIEMLYRKMINFYESPNFKKLLTLYKTDGYWELSKQKVRLWECIIAFHLDNIIKFLLRLF